MGTIEIIFYKLLSQPGIEFFQGELPIVNNGEAAQHEQPSTDGIKERAKRS